MALTPVLACRVCQTTDNLELIFTKENAEILSMLNSFLSTVITYNEALPLCICIQCIFTLEENYEFKSLYQKTYNKFKNINLRNEPWQDPQVKLEKSGGSRVFLADGTISDKSEIIEDSNKSKELDENEKEKSIDDNGDNSQEENSIDEIPVSNEPETFHAKMHQGMDTNLKLYKCDICGKTFATSSSFNRHFRLHPNPNIYKCDECGTCCADASSLKRHKIQHYDLGSNKCDMCGKALVSSVHLKRHTRRCRERAQRPKKPSSSLQKTSQSKRKPHKCDKCGQSFVVLSRYRAHVELHTNPDLYKCNDCGTRCREPYHLTEHQRRHCRVKGPFKCNHCEKIYATLDGLEKHQVLHFAPDIHKCQECGRSMKSLQSLIKHKALLHSNSSGHKCEICGKIYRDVYLFRSHVALHTNPNLYKCNLCDKSFCSSKILQTHLAWHANPDLYKCEICGKSFNWDRSLKLHMAWHADAFKCDKCGKSCSDVASLRDHQLLHSDPNMHKCEVCGKSLGSAKVLQRHRKSKCLQRSN